MQILVIFIKETRQVVASFEFDTVVDKSKILLVPEYDCLFSLDEDIFIVGSDGKIYVKNIEETK